MVGVAGRSIACHTCKKRKIRCGGEKPECKNCIKSNRPCAGYQRQHAFILSDYTKSCGLISDSSSILTDETDSIPVLHRRWRKPLQGESSPTRSTSPIPRPCPPPDLPVSISSRNVFRTSLIASFIDDQCPSRIISFTHPGPHRKWLLQLASLPSLAPALEDAILAVCTAKHSQRTGIKGFQHGSLGLYAIGLRKLQRAIDSPNLAFEEQTLAACIVLGMYEFTECPGQTTDAYIRHYHGALELMRRRGAESHSHGLAQGLLRVLRVHAVFNGLRQRQSTFLAQSEWIHSPWLSETKEPYDLLLDIFLAVPDLMSKMDLESGKHGSEHPKPEYLTTLSRCDQVYGKLQDWLSMFNEYVAGPLYWSELSTTKSATDDLDLGKLFPVSFAFPSFVVAETIVLYWTACAVLHSLVLSIHHRSHPFLQAVSQQPDGIPSNVPPRFAHHQDLLQKALYNICQSVDYFCGHVVRQIGPSTILPSLIVARAIFSAASPTYIREETWINEKLRIMQSTGVIFVESIS